jgi:hypothetical protein
MDGVTTITMDTEAALAAYREYQAAVRADRAEVRTRIRKEDEALRKAYLELSRGRTILDLPDAFRRTGIGADFYPRLAIARADADHCWVDMETTGAARFRSSEARKALAAERFDIPVGIFPEWRGWWAGHDATRPQRFGTARAVVPIIPPSLRPKSHLEKFWILWEAVWTADVPRDPMLLRPLGGSLWVVLATWDLSEIERAVLRGRL